MLAYCELGFIITKNLTYLIGKWPKLFVSWAKEKVFFA